MPAPFPAGSRPHQHHSDHGVRRHHDPRGRHGHLEGIPRHGHRHAWSDAGPEPGERARMDRGDGPRRGPRGRRHGGPTDPRSSGGPDHPGFDLEGRPDHGRPPFRGGGPRRGGRARRGDVRAAILLLLADEPKHGYQLIQEITARTAGSWTPSPGAVYPTLRLLEDEGLVTSSQDDGRRLVALTDAGRAVVTDTAAPLPDPFTAVVEAPDPDAVLRDLLRQVVVATGQVADAGTERQRTGAATLLTETRRALYLILAGDAAAASGAPESTSEATGDDLDPNRPE